jgi:ABC-type glycerol-3-phosphate transport system substrate-binding protein
MTNWFLEQELQRRDFLRRGGAGLLGVAAGGGLLAACGGDSDDTSAEDITGNLAKIRLERSPMRLHHDAGVGPLFEPYIADWNKKYPKLPLKTAYVAQDYSGTTQTQLAGGSVDYDVLFADTGFAQKWYDAGWIQALDDFPGLSEMVDQMDPRYPPLLRANDDKIISIPYYSAFELFVYNAEHLDAIGAEPPTTWDEFVEQCRELKSKGVVDTPFGPFWTQEFDMIWHEFVTETIAETGQQPFDDEDLSFTFADDPAAVATLERWQQLYSDDMVPKDIFTTAYGDVVNIFGGGKAAFTERYALQLKGWADPKQSKVADVAKNAVMPGATRETLLFGGYWMMPASTPQPAAAWQLMRYLAWKDRNGDPYVPINLVCIDIGGSTPFEEVNDAPEVKEARAKWADLEAYDEQAGKAQTYGRASVQEWFSEFRREASRTLQDVVRGKTAPEDGLASMREFVDSEREKAS